LVLYKLAKILALYLISGKPCYASLEEFLAGRNADGTEHKSYLVVDVVTKLVTDLRNREGKSVVPGERPLNSQNFFNLLISKPNSCRI